MFSVFLMMINIIHNHISLTHIISVHSLTSLTLTVAHNVATVNQHDTLVELMHSKIHFNINMSNNSYCKRQLHYTYFF